MTPDTNEDRADQPTESTTPCRGRVGPGQYVRPVGYAPERPVVRRVGDRDLFLGNAAAVDPDRHGSSGDGRPLVAVGDETTRPFDHVLSVSRDAYPATTHHHPLVDSDAVDDARFAAAVDAARDLHAREGRLLVHCEAGVSRSTAVLATALAAAEGRRFVDALHLVQDARPHALPNPALTECGVVYLAARGLG